jgi:CopG antitoxin of type II toxin-antitoxin system
MTTHKQRKSRIPEFKSYAEEAQWWDTHDITDYQDEFERVELEVAKPLTHILRLEMQLDPKIIDKLFRHAQQQGMDMDSVVRRWILENMAKLEKEQAAHEEKKSLKNQGF